MTTPNSDAPIAIPIVVKYSCALCGLHRVDCSVPARDPGEDIVSYMQNITVLVCIDHDRRSPGCKPKELSELLIPMHEGSDRIGGPRSH